MIEPRALIIDVISVATALGSLLAAYTPASALGAMLISAAYTLGALCITTAASALGKLVLTTSMATSPPPPSSSPSLSSKLVIDFAHTCSAA